MRKLLAIITLFSISLSTTAFAGSKYEELHGKYRNAQGNLTKQELLGAYLGRCYSPGDETPVGMILTTVNENQMKDGESVDSWKMAMVMVMETSDPTHFTGAPVSKNDDVTQDKINAWWKNPMSVVDDIGQIHEHYSELSVGASDEGPLFSTITATSKSHASFAFSRCESDSRVNENNIINIRKGQDGYLYGAFSRTAVNACGTVSSKVSCYFWKKLF